MIAFEPDPGFKRRYLEALRRGIVSDWIFAEALITGADRDHLLWLVAALAFIVDGHWKPIQNNPDRGNTGESDEKVISDPRPATGTR